MNSIVGSKSSCFSATHAVSGRVCLIAHDAASEARGLFNCLFHLAPLPPNKSTVCPATAISTADSCGKDAVRFRSVILYCSSLSSSTSIQLFPSSHLLRSDTSRFRVQRHQRRLHNAPTMRQRWCLPKHDQHFDRIQVSMCNWIQRRHLSDRSTTLPTRDVLVSG